jgi:hypothetical protein
VVNPSFEVALDSTPTLIGSFESFATDWRGSRGAGSGDNNPLMPSNSLPLETPFGV